MPAHKLLTPRECSKRHLGDASRHCPICDGGLSYCRVCKGGEASLPTECPGEEMTDRQQGRVVAGEIDFRGGRWVVDTTKET